MLALGSGAVAQEPSPPPWFGGRVEMPVHGFAVTLPDDWVGFDTAVDAASQVGVASEFLDSEVWFADGMVGLPETIAAAGSQGAQLMSLHATSLDHCLLTAVPVMPMPAHETAEGRCEMAIDAAMARDAEPPQRIDLPVGPAYHVRLSTRVEPVDASWYSSAYVLAMSEGGLMAVCATWDDRPDDDWLSIVETFEFLPEDG